MTGFKIHTDGGARGNPGPAGIGFVIADEKNQIVCRAGKFIGNTTNNVAEYQAVIEAFTWLTEKIAENPSWQEKDIAFFLDSELVVKQLNGEYRIKNENLRRLILLVRQKAAFFLGKISYSHVPREQNKEADSLVNLALDKVLSA